ncbi:hypothetical protein [Staphylococcus aureus]
MDASNDFEKGKNQNHLSDAPVEPIIDTYITHQDYYKDTI